MEHIEIENCRCKCSFFFNVGRDDEQYTLSHFTLRNLRIKADDERNYFDAVEDIVLDGVVLED